MIKRASVCDQLVYVNNCYCDALPHTRKCNEDGGFALLCPVLPSGLMSTTDFLQSTHRAVIGPLCAYHFLSGRQGLLLLIFPACDSLVSPPWYLSLFLSFSLPPTLFLPLLAGISSHWKH